MAGLRRAVLGVPLRELPWRATRDPWAVLVSECMLQQTQVTRVLEPYRAFLARFPTPRACAAAPLGDVLRAWAGLGYNRRAAMLHRAARAVVDRHGGEVPRSLDELLALPGVGPYTARAVAAFAYEDDAAVVDVNVARVLARAVTGRVLERRQAQALADELAPRGRSWAWNQAMVEVGALWCRAGTPICAGCPLHRCCAWGVAGRPAPDPAGRAARQSPFEGSDRQGRGRLLEALRRGPVPASLVASACGWPDDPARARRVAADLVREGLVRRRGGVLSLP